MRALARHLTGVLLVLGSAGCTGAPPVLHVGDPFPQAAGHSYAPGPELVWVMEPDDLFACQSAADVIRAAQQGRSAPIPLTVVNAGLEDWTTDFLRKHRLRATIITLDGERGRPRVRSPGTSRFHLLESGEISRIFPASDTEALRRVFQDR